MPTVDRLAQKVAEETKRQSGILQTGMPLFIFGSMRDLELLRVVLGRKVELGCLRPGVLQGYTAVKAKGEIFPILLPDSKAAIDGFLLDDLTPEDVARIEYYEEGLYRVEVAPILSRGMSTVAQVYIGYSASLTPTAEIWDFETFKKEARSAGYLEEVKDWMDTYRPDSKGGFRFDGQGEDAFRPGQFDQEKPALHGRVVAGMSYPLHEGDMKGKEIPVKLRGKVYEAAP